MFVQNVRFLRYACPKMVIYKNKLPFFIDFASLELKYSDSNTYFIDKH